MLYVHSSVTTVVDVAFTKILEFTITKQTGLKLHIFQEQTQRNASFLSKLCTRAQPTDRLLLVDKQVWAAMNYGKNIPKNITGFI